ncbi:ORC-CDC6 family AAA ATPase, partial [Yersinia aldovae]|uniref:ORC-CDC6 family AAA ATPase n=1 Tax=Yersinia aldovae TaxID=29483 RepID=UPI001643E2C3
MRSINSIIMRLAKRAEKLEPDHLVKSFVDVGPTYTLLSSTDNQIMFGRRGTGKTHFLAVLNNDILNRGIISVPIDMRLIGSTGGIFSDQNIPLSERATRLLSDTLCTIHEVILEYIFENEIENSTEITELLNEFIEQATALSIEGTSEEEIGLSNQFTKNSSIKTTLSNKGISASLDFSGRTTTGNAEKRKVTGKKTLRIHFGTITKLLNHIVSKLPKKELWVLIDEWSEIPLDLQPYLAELLRRILYPTPGITVKIAAIAHRCNFMERDIDTGISIGIELGSDASSVINLDEYMVFDNNRDAAKDFFKTLLHRHACAIDKNSICDKEATLFINDVFTQISAFDEYVRAVEGVPRDAINIISLAAQTALENKISILHIRKSAQKWFQVNKHAALNSRPEAVSLLDRIINEVIGNRKSRGFLISNEKNHQLIDYLYDMRVIHVLKQGVSAQNAIGKKYTLYALDYGCYVELISSKNAPLGLIIESSDNDDLHYIEVPKSDYRSVKNSILDFDNDNGQLRLNLITSTEQLQLPANQNKTKRSVEKSIDKELINSMPHNIGVIKISGTIYIPII